MKKELAYLLGYFYADGTRSSTFAKLKDDSISEYVRITLEIVTEDSKNLRECLDICGIIYTISTRYRENSKNEQTSFCLSTMCEHHDMFDRVMRNKLDMSEAISLIPAEIKNEFLKGFFDGDGCISISKTGRCRLYFYGNFEQEWSVLTNLLKSLDISHTLQQISRKGGKHKSTHICISNRYGINKLFEYLYQERVYNFGLARKYQKLLSVLGLVKSNHKRTYREQTTDTLKIYT